jgi:hypothetical protein
MATQPLPSFNQGIADPARQYQSYSPRKVAAYSRKVSGMGLDNASAISQSVVNETMPGNIK